MTHPILTKAAEALQAEAEECGFSVFSDDALCLTRAVFLAGREPDEGMIEAGAEAMSKSLRFRDGWTASIDHILSTTD